MITFFEVGGNILKIPNKKTPHLNSSPMSNDEPTSINNNEHFFEIRIKGQLSDIWADWFEGMTIESLPNGDTLLYGSIVDQSALVGILNKLVRLNLTLISMNEIKNKEKK